jgi:hypothetical protein
MNCVHQPAGNVRRGGEVGLGRKEEKRPGQKVVIKYLKKNS